MCSSHGKDSRSTKKKLLPNLKNYISIFQTQVNTTCCLLTVLKDFKCEKAWKSSLLVLLLSRTSKNSIRIMLLYLYVMNAWVHANRPNHLWEFFLCCFETVTYTALSLTFAGYFNCLELGFLIMINQPLLK